MVRKKKVDVCNKRPRDRPKKKVDTDLDNKSKKKVEIKKELDTDSDDKLEEEPKIDRTVYQGVEWTIENLSCWDKNIHGTSITSLTTSIFPKLIIQLYPRGRHGEDENVTVRICGTEPSFFSGQLSFYDSTGSLVCKHDIKRMKQPRKKTKGFKGPAYRDISGRVFSRTNKGRLTVRVWNEMPEKNAGNSSRSPESHTIREGYNIMQYTHTKIDEYDVTLQLPPGVFRGLGKTCTEIAVVGYYIDNPVPKELILSASKNGERISLSVRPLELIDKILVHTRLSVIHDECEKTELNKYVFGVQENWTFSESLTREVVRKEGFSLNLRFKIIPSITTNVCMETLTGFSTYVKGNALM